MKILILNWRDPHHPLAGGAEISLLEHARYWHKKGAEIIWFASAFPQAKKEDVVDGIRFVRAGSHYTVHFYAWINYIIGKFGKPDIIIDSFHFIPFFTPIYIKHAKILPLINEIASELWYLNLPLPFSYLGYHLEPYFIKLYKRKYFITGSESTKDELTKLTIPDKNIHVIHHGISTVSIGRNIIKENDPTIIFLARISKDKGIQDALQAFDIVHRQLKDAKLWIVGKEEKDGDFEKVLENTNINKKEIKAGITYFGYVSDENKFELLKRAWVLIHPSQKEGWGLNIIEANSVGTPAVGYNVTGLKDSVQNNKTGFLSEKTPEELSEKVLKLLNDGKLYSEFSVNALLWSKEFTWMESTKKSWNMLTGIMKENYKELL